MKATGVLLTALLTGALGSSPEHKGASKRAAPGPLRDEGPFPTLEGGTPWLNSPLLTPAALKGRVVLVEFWTYSCINWLRTLPYVRAWAKKYGPHGLVVIGVHTPEFEFEKKVDNVRSAAERYKVDYPIVLDSDYRIWRAFENQYWPALYFIDAKGRLRHHHFGEEDYEQSERVLQQLLSEAGKTGVPADLVSVTAQGEQAPADWNDLRTPETYVGYRQAENFASSGGAVLDRRQTYAAPAKYGLNEWALVGDWTIEKQRAVSNQAKGRVAFRFHARDVNLVMGPPTGAGPFRVRVTIDGQPPGASHGSDVDAAGNGVLDVQRLYQLIRQPKPIGDRQVEIEFLDPGVELYSFTFG